MTITVALYTALNAELHTLRVRAADDYVEARTNHKRRVRIVWALHYLRQRMRRPF